MDTRKVTIQAFLVSRTMDSEPDFLTLTTAQQEIVISTFGEALTAIEAHHDRTMVVTSRAGTETFTRCGICAWESSRPCMGLKLMASRYEDHPDFEQCWHVDPPSEAVPA